MNLRPSALALLALCACPSSSPSPVPRRADASPLKCVVFLHGKGDRGAATHESGGVLYLQPAGNAAGWRGRQWLYFPGTRYAEVKAVVERSIAAAGCDAVLIHGFSNGASAAAKLFCQGETFGHRVVGYLIDDPVPDHGADACFPAPGVKVRLYWTGGLARATEGWSCASADWTCEGGTAVGIERYARNLGAEVTPSIHRTHQPYVAPPEYQQW